MIILLCSRFFSIKKKKKKNIEDSLDIMNKCSADSNKFLTFCPSWFAYLDNLEK